MFGELAPSQASRRRLGESSAARILRRRGTALVRKAEIWPGRVVRIREAETVRSLND